MHLVLTQGHQAAPHVGATAMGPAYPVALVCCASHASAEATWCKGGTMLGWEKGGSGQDVDGLVSGPA